MANAALVVLSLVIALAGPRSRSAVLTLFTLPLAAGIVLALLFAGPLALAPAAAVVFGLSCAAFLLPHLLPRGLLFLLVFAAVPFGALGQQRTVLIAVGAVSLLLSALLAWRAPDLALRVACAAVGARLLAFALLHHQRLGWVAIGFAVLLASEAGLRLVGWPENAPLLPKPSRGRAVATWTGVLLGGAAAAALLLAPVLAPPLPPPFPGSTGPGELPPLPYAARREALQRAAPHGGLLWPLPSEAILWSEPSLDRVLFPRADNLDALYLGASPRRLYRLPGTTLAGALSLHGPIARQRLIHDEAALARLRAAAKATVAALADVLPKVKAGATELELEHAVAAAMAAHGCGRESFPLILASGPSAFEPHGSGNQGVLADGTLLVLDIGCYWDHYASDYTRTLPVGGRFTPRQRQLYQAVLAAQAAAAAACKPGVALGGTSKAGEPKTLAELARAALEAGAPDHRDHMLHGLGHTVGLFVHDVVGRGSVLEPGMVVTIEPGTYLEGELGIRIEDTYLVTKDGCEKLTAGFPAEVEAVEAAMAQAR